MPAVVSVIVFDLGNVLIPFDYSRAVQAINALSPGMGEEFLSFKEANYPLHRAFERGEISEEEFTARMLKPLNFSISPEQFKQCYAGIFTINEDVALLLPELKKRYRLYLLSNTNSIHQRYGWQEYKFLGYFNGLVLSHEVGAVKPEPAMYQRVMELSGAAAPAHLFIDDIAEYCLAARSVGWSAIQFTGSQQLRSELQSHGIAL